MNSRNISSLCSKKQSKGKPGTLGMSVGDLSAFLKKENRDVWDRMQTRKRPELCAALATFKAGRDLILASRSNSPKKKASPKKMNDPFAVMNEISGRQMLERKFQLTNEFGEVESNRNNNSSNNEGVNYGNESNNGGNRQQRVIGRRNWEAIRRAEAEPKFNGLRGTTRARVEKKLRRKKAKPVVGKTMAEIFRNELTMRPENVAESYRPTGKRPRGSSAPRTRVLRGNGVLLGPKTFPNGKFNAMLASGSKRRATSVSPRNRNASIAKLKAMGFKINKRKTRSVPKTFFEVNKLARSSPGATNRKPTRSQLVLGRKTHSPTQIKTARREANKVLSLFNKAGLTPNLPSKNASSNTQSKYQQELNNLKSELLHSELLKLPPRKPKSPKRPSFSMLTGLSNANKELSQLKMMKAKNKSVSQLKKQRLLQSMVNLRPKLSKMNLVGNTGMLANANNSAANNLGGARNEESYRKYGAAAARARVAMGGSQVSEGIMTNNASIQILRNKKSRGEQISKNQQRVLNVANALKRAAEQGKAAAVVERPRMMRGAPELPNAYAVRHSILRPMSPATKEAMRKRVAAAGPAKRINLATMLGGIQRPRNGPRPRLVPNKPATIKNARGSKGYYSLFNA